MKCSKAILIPGGGIKKDGLLPDWTQKKLDKAIEIFTGDDFIITLSAGTIHKSPLLDKQKFPIYESVVAANYLIQKGLPSDKILTETVSRDTFGNAYFARVIHTDPRGLRDLTIITSCCHMRRAKEVFNWIFSLPPFSQGYTLDYLETNDVMVHDVLHEKRRVEAKRLKRVQTVKKKGITTLPELHSWLFTEHKIYAVGLTPKRRLTGQILESY